ncbi:uncharacterized protein [Labrus bergylta]|uniref:uncharacterized protein n=1 Tax=Labrus bergylta TaxID=56723 RepID=UPI0033139F92
MQSTLYCFGLVGVVLLTLATPTLAFSRGASKASCHEMVPGHIRAQPQDPQHSHVTLRTSASSYLPGQLVTVTVRSSRNFMGFLLQARSVEGAGFRADVRPKVGVRYTRLGQVLDGGSWALMPPSTHVLRCFSEGDTLTHSDKQLKRNLSFVWKAPDAPIGDVKFYITVVQSYFVYWAGIESKVVRDGSRSPWNGSSVTGMDGGNLNFAQQEEEVTTLPALQVHGTSNNQTNETTSPATTLWPPTLTTNNKSEEPITEATQPVLEIKFPVTLASLRVDHPTNQEITENNIALTSASLQNANKDSDTDIYASSGSLSRVTEKAGTNTERPVTTLGLSTTTKRRTLSFKSKEGLREALLPDLEIKSSATLAYLGVDHLTNTEANERSTPKNLGLLGKLSTESETGTYASESLSGVTEEAETDEGSPVTTLGPYYPSSNSQDKRIVVTSPVFEINNSATSATLRVDLLTNQAVNERKTPMYLGSLLNSSKGIAPDPFSTSGSLSSVTKETGTDTGNFITQTDDPKNSLFPFNHLSFTATLSSAEGGGMEGTTTSLPNNTEQNSTNPLPNASPTPLKNGDIERQGTYLNDPTEPTVTKTKDTVFNLQTNTTVKPFTNYNFHVSNPPRSTSQNPTKAIKDKTSSVKFKTQSTSSQPSRINISETIIDQTRYEMRNQSMPQHQNIFVFNSETSSANPFRQDQTSTSKPLLQTQTGTSQNISYYKALTNTILQSKFPSFQSTLRVHTTESFTQGKTHQFFPNKNLNAQSPFEPVSNASNHQSESSPSVSEITQSQTNPPHIQSETSTPLNSTPELQPLSSFPHAVPQTNPTPTKGQADISETDQSQSDKTHKALSISPQLLSQPNSPTGALKVPTKEWTQTPSSVTPQPFMSRIDPTFTIGESENVKDPQSKTKIKTMSSIFASNSPNNPFPVSVSTHPSPNTPGSTQRSPQSSPTQEYILPSPSSTAMQNQPKTAPSLFAPPSPSPISIPPHLTSVQPSSPSSMPSSFSTSAIPSSNTANNPSPIADLTASASNTGLTFSSSSSSTISPDISSSSAIGSLHSSISPSSSTLTTSLSTASFLGFPPSSNSSATPSSLGSAQTTTPHPEPSPAPQRSLASTSTPVPSQHLTLGKKLRIQNHISSSYSDPNLNQPTSRTVVHPNPEPHPNQDPNVKQNFGRKLKPNIPKADTRPKVPLNPSIAPGKEGKYPDIIPRHTAWELGMLLGCSAGLGMVLVVGVRYIYRQACGKRTEVSFNDREREYSRGERGLIHVQECGDLVRVQRIRDNSFVLLAEYDLLASPGD